MSVSSQLADQHAGELAVTLYPGIRSAVLNSVSKRLSERLSLCPSQWPFAAYSYAYTHAGLFAYQLWLVLSSGRVTYRGT